jgi:polyhydroxyalkanoate synthesis regulator phasin
LIIKMLNAIIARVDLMEERFESRMRALETSFGLFGIRLDALERHMVALERRVDALEDAIKQLRTQAHDISV